MDIGHRALPGAPFPDDAAQPVQCVVPPGTQIQQDRFPLHRRPLHIGAGPEDGSVKHRAIDGTR